MEFTVGADLPLAVSVTSGNVVSVVHEITANCYGTKLATNTPGLTVQQERNHTEKLSPAVSHLGPMLNKASGSLLCSLECQRHAYYNCIKPFSSFFFFFCVLLKIVHFFHFRNVLLNAF